MVRWSIEGQVKVKSQEFYELDNGELKTCHHYRKQPHPVVESLVTGRALLQPRVVSKLDPLVAPRPRGEVEGDHREDQLEAVSGDGGDGTQGILTPNRPFLLNQKLLMQAPF